MCRIAKIDHRGHREHGVESQSLVVFGRTGFSLCIENADRVLRAELLSEFNLQQVFGEMRVGEDLADGG